MPRALWKHFLAAALCLICGGSLLAIGTQSLTAVPQTLPGFSRLISAEQGSLFRLFPASLLFLSGQAALIIWWYRSRSVGDFDGRFRRWGKIALGCFAVSFCVATELHLAWSDLCAAWYPTGIGRNAAVSWLIPAGCLMAILWLPLYRELQGNRLSVCLQLAATAMYLVALTLQLKLVVLRTPELNWLALTGISWLAHLLLTYCLALHVRHSMYFTAEPTESRSAGRRRDALHFLWAIPSRLFRRSLKDSEEIEGAGRSSKRESKKPAKAKSSTKARAAKPTSKKDVPAPIESDADDSMDDNADVDQSDDDEDLATSQQRSQADSRSDARPVAAPIVEKVTAATPVHRPEPTMVSRPQPQAAPPPQVRSAPPAAQNDDGEDNADFEDESNLRDGGDGQPDLRGLSKKQRRKLLRENRDRDQRDRRR